MSDAKRNQPTVKSSSIGAVVGAIVGGLLGLVWWTPATLIPIGLVVGIAVSQGIARR